VKSGFITSEAEVAQINLQLVIFPITRGLSAVDIVEDTDSISHRTSDTISVVIDFHLSEIDGAIRVVDLAELEVLVVNAESNSNSAIGEDDPFKVENVVRLSDDHLRRIISIIVSQTVVICSMVQLTSFAQVLRIVSDVEIAQIIILERSVFLAFLYIRSRSEHALHGAISAASEVQEVRLVLEDTRLHETFVQAPVEDGFFKVAVARIRVVICPVGLEVLDYVFVHLLVHVQENAALAVFGRVLESQEDLGKVGVSNLCQSFNVRLHDGTIFQDDLTIPVPVRDLLVFVLLDDALTLDF
jgi:hypothetical protein